jgi:F-type H+-transporting ATPase subunit delta
MSNQAVEALYAGALFSLAQGEAKIVAYQSALKEIGAVMVSYPDLSAFLASYAISKENKFELIDKLWGDGDLKSLAPFLKVLSDHHLISRFQEIEFAFDSLADAALGIKEGLVYSTSPLSEDDLLLVETALSQRLGGRISLKNRIDLSLLGGIKVAIAGKVFDGSLQAKLEALQGVLMKEGDL